MTHLVAGLFFSALIIGLAMVIQFTVRAYRQDIVDALLGRPMARHRIRPVETASVPRSRRPQRHAAAA